MTAPSIASLTEGVNQTARDSHSSIFGGFKYTPLDPSMDGIRLVLLCPSQAKSSVVECKVVHTAFGTKPSYEALSYTWGSDAVKKEILLDGKVFEIWENLWDALVNLRSSVEERSLWIDAICINQVNLVERNQQVQLMPYIYKRAQTVLIWLGLDIRGTDGSQKEDPVRSKDQVYLELCDRDYWKRVWIIQEIGKARRLKIHYGREIVEWNRFIEVVRSHQSNAYRDPDNIPMKLAEQLADRYGVGHQLRNLLITHQKALCKEPKDKIYGFIGLAIDCYGNFPMDYGKSLFEVYADVVLFQNKIPFDQRDILAFCRLAEYLLGGSNGLEAEELDKKIHDQKTNTLNLSDPTVLKVPAQLVGRIEHIGPSYRDMMAKVEKSDEWRVSIKRHLPEFQQKLAYEESDLFLEAVEGVDVLPQNKVFAFSRDTSWKFFKEPASITAFKNNYPRQFESTVVESPPQPAEPQDSYFSETRLFLLRTHTLDNNPCKMGLAPPSAQEGDFVCQIYEMERSVIVRQDSEKFTLVGCAGLAEDNITARRRKELGVSKPSIFSIPLFSSLGELEQMDLHMDIITAHEISRCDFSSGGSVDPGLSMDFETDTEIEGDIQVDSEVLGNTLRSIIQYYPTQDLTGKQITFHYPYRALMHYYGELQRLQANFGDDIRPDGPHPVNSTRLLGKQEHRELGILLNLIRKLYQNVVQDEISNYESSGTAAYEKLWLLFKPGIDVCARVHGKDAVFVVASTEHIVNQYSDSLDAWCIKVWNLGFDGRRLRRQGHTFYIKRYFGERSISLLNIFPITYSDNSNLEAQLISAGELFCHIINSIPAHMFYNGSTLGSNGEKVRWN
jgi:hypothetical protein